MQGSGSVFRRGGQKQELFFNVEDQRSDFKHETDAKLKGLLQIWQETRVGSHLSGSVWKQDKKAAEVFVQRGDQLSKMGFLQRGKTHLQIEEAVYLLERGDLLLIVELSKNNGRVMTLQEAYELMVSCGVSMAAYMVYCKLKRDGFIVKRHPSRWQLRHEEHAEDIWRAEREAKTGGAASTSDARDSTAIVSQMQFQRQGQSPATPSSRRQQAGDSRHWWLAMNNMHWLQLPNGYLETLPRCSVAASAGDSLCTRLPLLRPFPAIPRDAEWTPGPQHTDELVFDVYKPNPNFSKKKPDPVSFRVCLCGGMPTLQEMQAQDVVSAGAAVKFGGVNKGDITFLEFQRIDLPSLW